MFGTSLFFQVPDDDRQFFLPYTSTFPSSDATDRQLLGLEDQRHVNTRRISRPLVSQDAALL